MIAALLLASHLSFRYTLDDGVGVISVKSAHGIRRIVEARFITHKEPESYLPLKDSIKFQGETYVGNGESLIGSRTGASIKFPVEEISQKLFQRGTFGAVLHSSGGVALGNSMMWIYSWNNMDTNFDPAVFVVAFEVGVRNGNPVILRFAELPTMPGYGTVQIQRRAGQLFLTNASHHFAIFDLRLWKETASYAGGIYSTAPGRMYQLVNKSLSLSIDGSYWKPLQRVEEDFIRAIHLLAKDDVLEFDTFIMLARGGQKYSFKAKIINGWPPQIFVDRRLGVGIVWDPTDSTPGVVGEWLTATLKHRADIIR